MMARRVAGSGSWLGPHERAQHDEREEGEQHEAGDRAVLLGDDGEDEIRVRVGQRRLDGALAGPAAQETALGERAHGAVDLARIAGQRIEEAIDAHRHVRKDVVGSERPTAPAPTIRPAPRIGWPETKSMASPHAG